MTLIECTNPQTGLNLNPNQIFVFVNDRTKKLLPELLEYSKKQRSYEFVFIEDDPRTHIVSFLPETMDMLLYQTIMRSDMVARVMPSHEDDYRYITEIFPSTDDRSALESVIKRMTRRLKEEQYRSLEETLLTFIHEKNPEFSKLLDEAYDGKLDKFENISAEYAEKGPNGRLLKSEEFAYKFFKEMGKDLTEKYELLLNERFDYANSNDSITLFKNFIFFNATKAVSRDFEPIREPDFKIVISPVKKTFLDKDGYYDISVVDGDNIHSLSFTHKGAKMIYLLTLLSQKKIGGLPTNYFTTDVSKDIIKQIYDKVYLSGGNDFVKTMSNDPHSITMSRSHASRSIKDHWELSDVQKYWCDFENKTIQLKHRKVTLRSTRLPDNLIIIKDNPHEDVTLSELVEQLPQIDVLFGFKNTKVTQYLDRINKNLERAGKTPKYCNE